MTTCTSRSATATGFEIAVQFRPTLSTVSVEEGVANAAGRHGSGDEQGGGDFGQETFRATKAGRATGLCRRVRVPAPEGKQGVRPTVATTSRRRRGQLRSWRIRGKLARAGPDLHSRLRGNRVERRRAGSGLAFAVVLSRIVRRQQQPRVGDETAGARPLREPGSPSLAGLLPDWMGRRRVWRALRHARPTSGRNHVRSESGVVIVPRS